MYLQVHLLTENTKKFELKKLIRFYPKAHNSVSYLSLNCIAWGFSELIDKPLAKNYSNSLNAALNISSNILCLYFTQILISSAKSINSEK